MSAYINRKNSNKQPNATSQTPDKQQQARPKGSRRREITKIRVEINEIKTKKTIQSTKQKDDPLKK
jgi:hypothetical protein